MHKTNASIWFNKICRTEQLTIKYIQITVKGNTQRSQNTKKVATAHRLNQEIKFLYKKKCMLNKQLYIAHLDCANYWQNSWSCIQMMIQHKIDTINERGILRINYCEKSLCALVGVY